MSNLRLSHNLYRSEFACRCGCGFDTVDWELPYVIQDVIDHFQDLHPHLELRVKITSGCRCAKHNATIEGASPNSQHVFARAADFYIYDRATDIRVDPSLVATYLESKYPNTYGIGRYNGRTHLDTRATKHRWDYS